MAVEYGCSILESILRIPRKFESQKEPVNDDALQSNTVTAICLTAHCVVGSYESTDTVYVVPTIAALVLYIVTC